MASDSDHDGEKHPRISVDSILQAIETLKEPKGSCITSLKKYFCASLPEHITSREISIQIKRAVKKGLSEKKISKQGRSRFLLGLDDDDGGRKIRRRKPDDDDRTHRRRRRSRRRGRRRRRRSRRRSRRRRRGSRRRRRRSRRRGRRRRRSRRRR